MPDHDPTPAAERDVLAVLRDGRPRTRSELIADTGLSRSTVAARLEQLRAAGLVGDVGPAASSGGRRPSLVAFRPAARAVAVVDIGATHATAALSDLAGTIGEPVEIALTLDDDGDDAIAAIAAAVAALAGASHAPLAGIGIGLPGPVEHALGRPVAPPMMPHWHRLDVAGRLGEAFDVPVLVDNDVNLLALAERATARPDVDDLLYVKVATGIGAGIIAGGRLQRGARGSAGDLGHVRVPHVADSPRATGDDRDLEAMAAGPAIAAEIRAAGGEAETAADVAALLGAGDPVAVAATRAAGRLLGEVLATVAGLLGPAVVVIGGSIGRSGPALRDGILDVLPSRTIPLAGDRLDVVASTAGASAGLRGAAELVLDEILDPRALPALRGTRGEPTCASGGAVAE